MFLAAEKKISRYVFIRQKYEIIDETMDIFVCVKSSSHNDALIKHFMCCRYFYFIHFQRVTSVV